MKTTYYAPRIEIQQVGLCSVLALSVFSNEYATSGDSDGDALVREDELGEGGFWDDSIF